MLRTLLIVAAAGLMALSATVANAAFPAGTWELTLSGTSTVGTGDLHGSGAGSGGNNTGFTKSSAVANDTTIGLAAGLGYYVTKEVEVSLRQGYAFVHTNAGGEGDGGSTQLAGDWNFDAGNFVPFIGGAIGATYAKRYDPSFGYVWAPEAGVKLFLNSTTFIYALVQFQVPMEHNVTQSAFVTTVGIGLGL